MDGDPAALPGYLAGPYQPYVLNSWQRGFPSIEIAGLAQPLVYAFVSIDEGTHVVAESGGRTRTLREGAIYLLRPRQQSLQHVAPGSRWMGIKFEVCYRERRFKRNAGGALQPRGPRSSPPGSDPLAVWGVEPAFEAPPAIRETVRHRLRAIVDSAWRPGLSRLWANAQLALLLAEWLIASEDQPHDVIVAADPRIVAAEERVRLALPHPVSVAMMAEAAGLSRARFHVLYTEHRSETPVAFIRRERLRRAERALRAGAGVVAAAREAGLSSTSGLNKLFRSTYDLTPMEWQRLDRSGSVLPNDTTMDSMERRYGHRDTSPAPDKTKVSHKDKSHREPGT